MATDAQTRFHEEWLGLAQPYEGLVFSVPVLADAQIVPQVGADLTARFRRALVMPDGDEAGHIGDLRAFFEDFLGYTHQGAFIGRDALPAAVHFYAQEGGQELRPSFGISRSLPQASAEDDLFGSFGDEPAASAATPPQGGSDFIALVWDVRDDGGEQALGLNLDKPEELTGSWRYPPTAKFERMLRAVGIAVGFICNGRDLRLVYAPPGEATSHLTFRGDFMQQSDGRPLLAAFELLLNANRTYQSASEFTFEGLLKESRSRQADVTKELASQVFEAVELLLSGFEAAGNRDSASGRLDYLRAALEAPHDHAYQGVLSVVLRLVFLLYAEDQGLLPVDDDTYASHLSVKGLYDELVADAGQHPESMHHRFGAYGRLLSLFRAVFYGVEHGELKLPPRRGRLFDPNSFPFLEGGLPGSTAAYRVPEERAATVPPSVDDGTVYEVLHRLIFFQGQRLSYASLDVEQLGAVYESLMGYHILRTVEPAVRLGKTGLWVELGELRKTKAPERKKLLKEDARLSTAQVTKVDKLLKELKADSELAEALNELSPGGKKQRHKHRASVGRLVLQPGEERRRSGSHYTPRSLTEGIVRRTLEPLLKCMGDAPAEEQILSLKICDPAMGSGAFLVEVVRQLGAKIVEVWTREGRLAAITEQHANPHLHASRLVAQRCVYGVDKNAAAVELAKLSLWLVTLSADLPFTFVDHALRHGDSLVGLSLDQVSSFHWTPGKQLPLFQQAIKDSLDQALEHRADLLALARDDSPRSQEERRRLLDHAEQATDRVRMIADICVGAFFAEAKDKARNAERVRRMDLVELWLKGETTVEPELRAMADDSREKLSPFHWMLEFPEVFYLERPDPLDGDKVNGAAMMDGFVGNPPFLGGKTISTRNGNAYAAWLEMLHQATKNCDLAAHFFRRTQSLLGRHGTVGLVSTNTLSQGDTRRDGLAALLRSRFRILDVRLDLPWPGEAAVTVHVVVLGAGKASEAIEPIFEGRAVENINSRLRPKPERDDPRVLERNAGASFNGVFTRGSGFVLETTEAASWLPTLRRDEREFVRSYIGGEEINTSPTSAPDRFVVDVSHLAEPELDEYPHVKSLLEARVKPYRLSLGKSPDDIQHKLFWWRFARARPDLRAAIAPLSRCLVNSQVTKHLVFAWQPTDRIFAHTLYAYPLEANTPFAVLQSRIHEFWARLLSSSMKTDLRYAASDCFETFPFPQPDPRTVIPELEAIGEKLYQVRAKYMIDADQGLTKTYNALKDPACTDARIIELRHLHEEMDRAVLRAYPQLEGVGSHNPEVVGWSDIEVPPFCIATDEDRTALQTFEDEVIDRLFVLNELRAKEEAAQPNKAQRKSKKSSKRKKGTPNTSATKKDDQGDLF